MDPLMKLAELEVTHEDLAEQIRTELARGRAFEHLNGEILATLVVNRQRGCLVGWDATVTALFDALITGWYAQRARLRGDTDDEAKIDRSAMRGSVRVGVLHDGRSGVQGGAVRAPAGNAEGR